MFEPVGISLLRQFIQIGHLTVRLDGGTAYRLDGPVDGPHAQIGLADSHTLWRLVVSPDLAFGESFMDGQITLPDSDLESLINLLMLNSRHWSSHWLGRLTRGVARSLSGVQHLNRRGAARRNVAHHYDLSEQLFDSFLDPWRQYSCGYFHNSDVSLEEAQTTKLARLAAKLNLRQGDRVLDIGCGWGGLATALIKCVPDIHVTGITLSSEQLTFARHAAAGTGLADRLDFQLRDYRDQQGRFDKIVSVGMLEHVGPRNYRTYFDKVRSLLTDDGIALIHSIGVHHQAAPVNRWLTKYIFPGGYLPSPMQMMAATEGRGLKLLDLEIMRGHYAETLRHWRLRFLRHRRDMVTLYDERFVRMWEFYLLGSEYFFRCQHGMVMQMQLSKDQMAAPMSRHSIPQLEDMFRKKLWTAYPSGNARPSAK